MTSAKKISFVFSLILVFTLLFSFCAFAEPGDEGQVTEPVSHEQSEPAPTPDPTSAPTPTPEPTPSQEPTQVPQNNQNNQNNQRQQPQGTTAARNSDNTLKSLSVSGKTENGETVAIALEPAFKADVREYSISVPFEVVRLEINADANNSRARINIPAGYLKLDLGANKSFIYVTAENGTRRTYQINTVRNEQQETTTEPTTVEETTEATTAEAITAEATMAEVTVPDTTVKSGMNTYTKLGCIFAAAGILLLICSVVLFIRKRNMTGEIEE
ncbi:MAG TPA: hypothetical protein DCR23_06105 [Ruminococcaceae bacterium]|nr:hypothetical protein [Oscillospiraceae bacterium]